MTAVKGRWKNITTDKIFVYFLVNEANTIEYVGMTNNVFKRLRGHFEIKRKKNTGNGKFFGREDLTCKLLPFPYDRKTAFQVQVYLQEICGLKTDSQAISEGMKASNKKVKVLTLRQKKNIHNFYKQGLSKAEIAEKYRVAPKRITRVLREHVQ